MFPDSRPVVDNTWLRRCRAFQRFRQPHVCSAEPLLSLQVKRYLLIVRGNEIKRVDGQCFEGNGFGLAHKKERHAVSSKFLFYDHPHVWRPS